MFSLICAYSVILQCVLVHSDNDISATILQELAHVALMDGNCHPEIAALAALGTFGHTQPHINRDLRRRRMRDDRLCPSSVRTAPSIDLKGKSGVIGCAAQPNSDSADWGVT